MSTIVGSLKNHLFNFNCLLRYIINWITFRNDLEVLFMSIQLHHISIIWFSWFAPVIELSFFQLDNHLIYSHDDFETTVIGKCTWKVMKRQNLCPLSIFSFAPSCPDFWDFHLKILWSITKLKPGLKGNLNFDECQMSTRNVFAHSSS